MDKGLMRHRLVETREFNGYNRKEFAELLGIPYRTITNYENGSREPGSDYLARVADVCGCTVDWLLGLTDDARETSPYSDLGLFASDPLVAKILNCYNSLNDEGRERLAEYADDLVKTGKYIKTASVRMGREA